MNTLESKMKVIKVLIAEAHPIFLADVADFVMQLGHDVVYKAAGGNEALAAFFEYDAEVVITDVTMAHGTAIDLLQGILRQNKLVPCLVHSQLGQFIIGRQEMSLEDLKKTFPSIVIAKKPDNWSKLGYIKEFLDSLQK